MCASCGFPAAAGHWADAGAASSSDRARRHVRRIQILRAVLSFYGIRVQDGMHVPGLHLATLTGKHAIARDLDQLWSMAEAMLGKPIDPLDPRFLCNREDGIA